MEFFEEKELFVPVDGAKLFCRVFGEKNPPIIVMHGGPGLGQNHLLPQMAALGKFAVAIFYDQRGTGKSTSDDDWQLNPFQTYVRDVNQLREAFSLETVSLLAHSWGGILASLYAIAYPQHVDKIIYVNTVPVSSTNYMDFVKHRSQIVNANQDELDSIRASLAFANGDPAIVEKFYRIYFKHYFRNPQHVNALTLKMSANEAINNFKIYDLFYNYALNHPFDLYGKLKTLNKRSLIIACDQDVVPLTYMEKLHTSILQSELVLLKDCGHFPYIEQPDLLFKTIHTFIKN